jgi:hypothetical protein
MSLASFSLICGVAIGIEYIEAMPEENIDTSIILDFIIFRFIFVIK